MHMAFRSCVSVKCKLVHMGVMNVFWPVALERSSHTKTICSKERSRNLGLNLAGLRGHPKGDDSPDQWPYTEERGCPC